MNKKIRRIIYSGLCMMSRSKFRTFFMMLSIIIGITALTLTINVGNGIEKKIMDNVGKFIGPENIMVVAEKPSAEGLRESEKGPNTTLKIEDIEAIVHQMRTISMYDYMQILPEKEITYLGENYFTTVKGCTPVGEMVWNKIIENGQFFDQFDIMDSKRVAVLGPKMVKILFKYEDPIGKQFKISNIPFTVIGVLQPEGADPHGNDLDDDIYIPITTLMRRVANVDYIMNAKFVFETEEQSTEAESGIRNILRERHVLSEGEPDDFNILTPVQVKTVVASMVKIFNVLLPSIAIIALLAGAIVIVILMNIAVNQRVKEIGLRKATGARDKDIIRQFLSETIMIVLIGGILGTILGLVVAKLISFRLNSTFYISSQTFIIGVLVPVFIGLVSGIIPARKAAKLDPVESMK